MSIWATLNAPLSSSVENTPSSSTPALIVSGSGSKPPLVLARPSLLSLGSLPASHDSITFSTENSTEAFSSGVASSNSTPPTSLPDTSSMDIDLPKRDNSNFTPSPNASKTVASDADQPDETPEAADEEQAMIELDRDRQLHSIRKNGSPNQREKAHEVDDLLQAMIAQNASDPANSTGSPTTNLNHSPEDSVNINQSIPSAGSRPKRNRGAVTTYNLAKLSGTDVHGKRASKGDDVDARRRERRRTTGTIHMIKMEGSPDPAAAHIPQFLSSADRTLESNSDRVVEITKLRSRPKRASTGALPSASATSTCSFQQKSTTNINTSAKEDNEGNLSRSSKARGLLAAATAGRSKASQANTESAGHHGRYSTRNSGLEAESLATKLGSLNKRSRNKFEKGITRMSRELRRLQDTNEFAHIETKPVLVSVWSNGKEVKINPVTGEPEKSRKNSRPVEGEEEPIAEAEEEEKEEEQELVSHTIVSAEKKAKKWLDRGLYSGQDSWDPTLGLSPVERKKLCGIPELMTADLTNKTFPTPIFNGLRMLIEGRDFKLPFDLCNPLPPGLPKPEEWRKITKNRFVGDAAAIWKKTPHFTDSSTCVCTPEDGCAEDCQNRIMLYECDNTNCNVGREHCTNRAFQDLQDRVKGGGKYRVGVEVFKTEDRGYGVRSNRCFHANQIIMEYTGEIITDEECDRRMKNEYKNNECYYLMSFDQNMIIDATTGSIARFVNHSCAPNCRMIKWIVAGQPRMALFAGDEPIMTGDELTYDYNFDPFSAKNVQKCLCGSANCRGVLGPKTTKPNANFAFAKDKPNQKLGKASAKAGRKASTKISKSNKAVAVKGLSNKIKAAEVKAVKGSLKRGVAASKRKIRDVFAPVGNDIDDKEKGDVHAPPAKKQKTSKATASTKVLKRTMLGVKRSIPGKSDPAKTSSKPGIARLRGRSTVSAQRRMTKRASTSTIDKGTKAQKSSKPIRKSMYKFNQKSTDALLESECNRKNALGEQDSTELLNHTAHRPRAFGRAHFGFASPTPDVVSSKVQAAEALLTPQTSDQAPGHDDDVGEVVARPLQKSPRRLGGRLRTGKTLPKIKPINRNRGGDIESSTTASSVDEVPPASSVTAAAARAKATSSQATEVSGSDADRTPPRKRRRVQIPKPPISASRSSSLTYVESTLVTGGPAYKSPTNNQALRSAPATIPSVNGATLIEGKDFVPAFDDDDIMDFDEQFAMDHGAKDRSRTSLRNFDRSPGRGMNA